MHGSNAGRQLSGFSLGTRFKRWQMQPEDAAFPHGTLFVEIVISSTGYFS